MQKLHRDNIKNYSTNQKNMKQNLSIFIFVMLTVMAAKGNSNSSKETLCRSEHSSKVVAHLENEMVRISFVTSKLEGKKSITLVYEIKTISKVS